MKISPVLGITAAAMLAAALGGAALARQDRAGLRVPDGLVFADFKGYESWEPVSASHTDTSIKVIAANPMMIRAYRAGLHAKGKVFPDGSRSVKLEWARQPSPDLPGFWVAGELKSVQFMEKDSKRYAATGGWAYAKFNNDAATGALTPQGTGVACGHACHTIVADKDYVFTTYPPR